MSVENILAAAFLVCSLLLSFFGKQVSFVVVLLMWLLLWASALFGFSAAVNEPMWLVLLFVFSFFSWLTGVIFQDANADFDEDDNFYGSNKRKVFLFCFLAVLLVFLGEQLPEHSLLPTLLNFSEADVFGLAFRVVCLLLFLIWAVGIVNNKEQQ